jgi:hypothetical protein
VNHETPAMTLHMRSTRDARKSLIWKTNKPENTLESMNANSCGDIDSKGPSIFKALIVKPRWNPITSVKGKDPLDLGRVNSCLERSAEKTENIISYKKRNLGLKGQS